jgi:hypothetical protein
MYRCNRHLLVMSPEPSHDPDGLASVVVRPSKFGPAVYADGTLIIIVAEDRC